ncbi:DUF4380 domain-containing protein, partial [Xanthomonas oryzae]|uniref:DUF4380 domain-containing protein n=1 Tax=Xanthomonas oryzae TaxID=347 RepID=UPI00117CB870
MQTFGSEVAQVRSPGPLHNRWCCDPELKPPVAIAAVRHDVGVGPQSQWWFPQLLNPERPAAAAVWPP